MSLYKSSNNKVRSFNGSNGLITCGSDAKAKLWQLEESENNLKPSERSPGRWEAVRTFSYLGLKPKCSSVSPDQSVIAICFGGTLTLWDGETFSLLTCLSVKEDQSVYTSVMFGDRTSLPHLVLATTESHVLVWNLLTNHLVKKMALDRPTLFHLRSHMIGVLHSHGAVALDHALTPSLITKLENVSGIASDDRTGRIYAVSYTHLTLPTNREV